MVWLPARADVRKTRCGAVSWVLCGRAGSCSSNDLSLVWIHPISVGNYVPSQHYLESSLEEAQCSANQQNPTTKQPPPHWAHVCWTLGCPGRRALHCSGFAWLRALLLCVCVKGWVGRDNKMNSARLAGLGTSHSIILSSSLIVLPPTCFPPRTSISSLLAWFLFPLCQVLFIRKLFAKAALTPAMIM